ncbi:estradiol 17-beta-dehydrogenase 8 [Patella vulgata]|uniref:estradiol 17-beta-dehydrogenase 8 n=1 Tax=Patella vulgata TaxID=6465 RepID=UPI0024A94F61|nr:estradiol 17-beta-dehydrogenase 8 [Patella vulgata]
MSSLEGKVIIITGASAGIGESIAVLLARYKPKLVLAARGTTGLEFTRKQCQDAGLAANSILTLQCDVSKDDNLENLVQTTIQTFGSIYGLVNNAGYGVAGNIEQTNMKDYDGIMRVNMRAPFYLSKLCIPHLKTSKGCVINVSSIVSKTGIADLAAYSLSKAALDHFTHLLAAETGPSGVRVNSVNPGYIRTLAFQKAGLSEKQIVGIEAGPLDRVGETEDVAKLVKFLLSDESSYITGETICVDGGRANPVFS